MRWTSRGDRRGRRPSRRAAAVALAAAALLATAGCGAPTGGDTPGGSLTAAGIDLTGETYTVGGTGTDEQRLLCAMAIAALRSVGATVGGRCGLPDATATRAALTGGQIDVSWSYTGTAWTTALGNTTTIPDARRQYLAVRDADLAQNRIVWLPPTPFDSTSAIATTRAFAQQNALRTTTDWAALVTSGSPAATTCVEPGFAARPDGLAGLFRAYGVTDPPQGPPRLNTVDATAIPRTTANGNPCHFGEVSTTDGRLPGLDLVPLEDDRGWFPQDNASPTIRQEVFDRDPAIARVFGAIAPLLTDQVMLDLNGRVSAQGQDPDLVATRWLQQQGFIGGS